MIIVAPNKVLIEGTLSNKKYPIKIAHIIKEYSNKETTDGEAML